MTMRQMSQIVRDQKPVTMSPNTTIIEACRKMRDHRVGAVLVTGRDGKLVGIFTGRDAVCKMLAAGKDAHKTTLSEVMTRGPQTMPPTNSAIDALRLMHDGGFRHVPVVADDKVVGVVSHGDFRGLERARLDEETDIWERI
jgi:CBS domain-containing protein